MPLQLSKASFEDLHEMFTVVFEAYSNPPEHPFVALLFPGLDSNSSDTNEKSIRDVAEGPLIRWKASSTEHWVKVIDTETGAIVG
jgi:hypothetical protein